MRSLLFTLFSTAVATSASFCPSLLAADASKPELLNNSASLLADLLGNEKNLNKILIVKGHSHELGALVDAIAQTAAAGEKQLELLAQDEPGMDLKAIDLPPGERAARKGISKTKEHDLIFSTGDTFAYNLLVTQTDALSYGSHLAEIVSENLPSGEPARQFHSLAENLKDLLKQVNAQIRSLPKD